MSASQVTAGGVVVQVLADNKELEKGLRQSAQKLSVWAAAARSIVGTAVTTGGTAVATGLAGAAVAGRALVNTVGSAGKAIQTAFGGREVANLSKSLDRLTPVSARVWDVTQSGVGRGTRLLSVMRDGLAAAGVAAMPLLAAFDGISRKSAGIITGAKWKSLFKGDFASAGMFSMFQQPAREAWLQDRWRRGGATGVVGKSIGRLFNPIELFEGMTRFAVNPFKTVGAGLRTFGDIGFGGIGGRLNIAAKGLAGAGVAGLGGLVGRLASGGGAAAKSLGSIASQAIRSTIGIDSLSQSVDRSERSLGRFLPRLSSIGAGLRTLAFRGGVIGGGILGTLTAAAGIAPGGLSSLFSAHGFAKYASELGDAASAHKTGVGVYSNYHAAAQLAGISLDDAMTDPKKMAQVEAQRGRAASLGGFVTADQVALAKQANTATAEAGLAFRAVGTAIGTAVLPQIISGVQWTTNFASTVATFIQRNPELIQQLFSIGKGFAIGAAGAAAIATAVGFVMSPMGAAAVAVGVLSAAFPTLWAMAAPYLGNVTSAVQELGAGFDLVWGGIMNALAAGNLGLAAEVAWAGLLVAWETGIDAADQKWREWSGAIADVIDTGLTEARVKLDEWFPGFEKGFSSSMAFLEDAWTVTVNSFLGIWDTIQRQLSKSILYLASLFDSSFNIDAAYTEIDQQFDKKLAQRTSGQDDLLAKREKERSERNTRLDSEGTAKVLRDENEQRSAERAAKAAQRPESDRLKAARARLDAAMQTAAAERKAADAKRAQNVTRGSLQVKQGIAERETRGAAANDIRTREGLQDVLGLFRGRSASLNTLANQGAQQLKALQDGNAINDKSRDLLDQINRKPANDKPIGP